MTTDAEVTGAAARSAERGPTRGRLRVYMGAAPGSGKTFAMLREAHERRGQGEDIVVGYVETHGRPRTEQAIGTLEVIPRLHVDYQGHALEEMDLDAVLARRPQVALVDELAHTNAPGVRHAKRWQDVEDILGAGIDVITTVNVQHLESVSDLVEHITGIPVRETLPDSVLDQADEIQFIDISPEALRKRMQHGNVYAKDRVPTALANFFRPGNLAALREIALRLVAQRVGTRSAVRSPQDVLVAVSGGVGSAALIRRAARIARRFDGLCTVLSVVADPSPDSVVGREKVRGIAQLLQCAYIERGGRITDTVIATARELGVQHVVIGESERPGVRSRLRRGLIDLLITELPDVSVHVIARRFTAKDATAAERPDSETLLRALQVSASRAALRLYLGYAPGVGATLAMLEEARRRASRGTDVVVAAVDTRHRPDCDDVLQSLEILGGPRSAAVRGRVDVDALMRRNPDVACIDDLANDDTNGQPIVESVPRLLRNGIVLVGTVHLTSLRSTVEGMGPLLGPPPEHVLDDSALDLAGEIELVDVTPSVLDDRLRRGEILPPSRAAQARNEMFRPEVLTALREMAFRVIAEHTDRRLVAYMRQHGIATPWEVRARVMLCIPPREGMEETIRQAEDMVRRLDGRLITVTVRDRERSEDERLALGRYAALVHQADGEFVTLNDRDPAAALATFARRTLATQVVVTRGRGRRGTLRRLIRLLSDVDVHVLPAPRLDAR